MAKSNKAMNPEGAYLLNYQTRLRERTRVALSNFEALTELQKSEQLALSTAELQLSESLQSVEAPGIHERQKKEFIHWELRYFRKAIMPVTP
jgi:hypothetical protein